MHAGEVSKAHTHTSLFVLLMQLKEKAEAREKERLKAEEKKAKKRESSFRQLLKSANPPLSAESIWDEVGSHFVSTC